MTVYTCFWAMPGKSQPGPIYTSKQSHLRAPLFAGCLHRRQPWGTCRGLCPPSDESMQNASESKGKSKENGSPQDEVAVTARQQQSHPTSLVAAQRLPREPPEEAATKADVTARRERFHCFRRGLMEQEVVLHVPLKRIITLIKGSC